MGTGTKVLLTLGVVFGALLLLCCGVIGGGAWWFGHSFTQEPAAVRQITDKIVAIHLPPQFAPVVAGDNVSIPFTGVSFSLAVYAENPAGNTIMLAAFRGKGIENMPQQQLQVQLKQSMASQPGGARQMTVEESHQRTITVRGKPIAFTFSTGKEFQSGKPWLQVTGMFQGDSGMTLFTFSGDASQYRENQVVEIIETIR
jgi:hypothetical protein